MKFVALLIVLFAGCQPQATPESPKLDTKTNDPSVIETLPSPDEAPSMKPIELEDEERTPVVKVIYTAANGSLPPPSQYENIYELTANQAPDFDALVAAALDETQVNDVISLRGYMTLKLRTDARFAAVRAISDADIQPSGGESQTVKFVLEDGREFAISNYGERLRGTALGALKQAAKEKGQSMGFPARP
ncbi:MAG: hypothetical protein R3E66_04710 [bacterium]